MDRYTLWRGKKGWAWIKEVELLTQLFEFCRDREWTAKTPAMRQSGGLAALHFAVVQSGDEVLISVTSGPSNSRSSIGAPFIQDERDPHAARRRVRRNEDLLPFKCRVQIVHGKSQVQNGFHDLRHTAMRVETHPLDAVRARFKAAHMNAELVQVPLPVTRSEVRDSEVAVAPAEPRDRRGIFVALSHAIHRLFRQSREW